MAAPLTRAGASILGALLLSSCYRPAPLAADRALRLWRARASRATAQRAMASAAGAVALDVERAVERALRDNAQLRAARAQVLVAQAERSEDAQLDNPELRLRDLRFDRLADSEPRMSLGLRVPIPRPWMLDARGQRAEVRVAEARAAERDLERRVRARVRKLFARLGMLAKDAEQIERTIALCATYRKLAEQRVRDGAATTLDASLPALRHAEAIDERHALRVRRAEVLEELHELVGGRPDEPLAFTPAQLSDAAELPALDEHALVERALRQRHDLREAAARVAEADADTYLARAQRWPWLRFAELSYNIRPDSDPRAFELAVAIELPLLSWNRGAIATREARLTRRRAEERAAIFAAAREVSGAVARLRETHERLAAMQRTLLPALEAGTKAIDAAVAHGVADPLTATIVEWRRVRGQRKYLKARLERDEALIEVEAAIGGPLGGS